MPYEYPIAWRLCVAGARRFHEANGAYLAEPHLVPSATYSCASQDEYFEWQDAKGDDARALAEKFIVRFPEVVSEGLGRDWTYAGWLSELVGFLERGDLLPFVMAEYYEPSPEQLTVLPIRDHAHQTELEFPLPPRRSVDG